MKVSSSLVPTIPSSSFSWTKAATSTFLAYGWDCEILVADCEILVAEWNVDILGLHTVDNIDKSPP